MKKFDFSIFISMIIASILTFFLWGFLFTVLEDVNLILISAILFGLAGFISIVVLITVTYHISPLKNELSSTLIFKKLAPLLSIGALILCFGLGGLFQYLYNLNADYKTGSGYDNYIVAIDNSGSMRSNDPHFERYNSLSQLMEMLNKKQEFAVYTYSNDSECIFPLQTIDKERVPEYMQQITSQQYSSGGTNTMGVLSQIVETPFDKKTAVILISDGQCNVDDDVLKKIRDQNIPIHTIQVSGGSGFDTLMYIAEYTGGDFYNISDISGLGATYAGIYFENTDYFLLSERPEGEKYHGLLRILFIAAISLLIKIFQVLVIDISRVRKGLILQSILLGLSAGILTEVLLQYSDISENIVHFVLLFLTFIIFTTCLEKTDIPSGKNIFTASGTSRSKSISDKNKMIK